MFKAKLNKEKNEEIEAVKRNTERIKEIDGEITEILSKTVEIKNGLDTNYHECLGMFNGDYSTFDDESKMKLGSMVNLTKALSAMYNEQVSQQDIEEV